jgi:nucleotide-binding universal stress UspA family protein
MGRQMQLKDVLVHVDTSERCRARLEMAAWLTERHEAHLKGIYITPSVEISPFLADQFRREDLDKIGAQAAQKREAAEALFKACCGGIRESEWIEERGNANDVLISYGLHNDITILGQFDPRDPDQRAARMTPEHIVVGTGQPILVVPFAGSFRAVGERILVAWNASAQASRAIRDAMPFLTRAKQVTVLVVNLEASGSNLTLGALV